MATLRISQNGTIVRIIPVIDQLLIMALKSYLFSNLNSNINLQIINYMIFNFQVEIALF